MSTSNLPPETHRIALIGLGAIGVSFLALHLKHSPTAILSVYDNRPDLSTHISSVLPGYIDSSDPSLQIDTLQKDGRLRICSSLEEACRDATIIQEQGPERLQFKREIWAKVSSLVGEKTRLWSSTSGIAASFQGEGLSESARRRLLVVHPFNPPHIMPLLEIVPSPATAETEVSFAVDFFEKMGSGHRPVVVRKEVPGFVGNRLAFVLLREACWLVSQGVVRVEDVDTIMEASLGPRWAVNGPFRSYNQAGSLAGIGGFIENLRGTMQEVWDGAGRIDVDREGEGGAWKEEVVRQTGEVYGRPSVGEFGVRDKGLREVLMAQEGIVWPKEDEKVP